MTHFVKIYSSILDSTIWAEPAPTVKVWLTLLAMADPYGFVDGAMLGVMRRAIVSREECETAIRVLESPDPDSKTPDHEGRRIERKEGGWQILNHRKYRDLRTDTQIATAQRVKQHRDKAKALHVTDVTNVTRRNGKKHDVRTEVEVDTTKATTSTKSVGWVGRFLTAYTEATKGAYSAGRLGRELKDLIRDNGENPAFIAWTAFLASPDRKYGPPYFAKNYVDYAKRNGSDPAHEQFVKRGYLL